MGVGLPGMAARQAERAEAAGFDGIAMVDSQNLAGDPYVALAVAARATSTLRLGTGVTNPVTRHPAVTAAAIASVQGESGGRAVLGIGRGDSALAHLGQAPASGRRLRALPHRPAGLPRGRAVDFEDPTIGALGLAGAPADSRMEWIGMAGPKVPVDVAATGPKVLAVAARLADRVTFAVGADPERVAWARDTVVAARATPACRRRHLPRRLRQRRRPSRPGHRAGAGVGRAGVVRPVLGDARAAHRPGRRLRRATCSPTCTRPTT